MTRVVEKTFSSCHSFCTINSWALLLANMKLQNRKQETNSTKKPAEDPTWISKKSQRKCDINFKWRVSRNTPVPSEMGSLAEFLGCYAGPSRLLVRTAGPTWQEMAAISVRWIESTAAGAARATRRSQICHWVKVSNSLMLAVYLCLLYTSDAADE